MEKVFSEEGVEEILQLVQRMAQLLLYGFEHGTQLVYDFNLRPDLYAPELRTCIVILLAIYVG